MMASVLEDFYRLFAYLEDFLLILNMFCWIQIICLSILIQANFNLVVIPCQSIVNEGYTLEDCVNKMFEDFI